jgi:hypothetical protein
VLSSLAITIGLTSTVTGRAKVATSQPQVTKRLSAATQVRAYLTSGVTLRQFVTGLAQGRASTESAVSVIPPVQFLPLRPTIVITEAARPIATITARDFPQATIAARAYPVASITESVKPVTTISERARPTAIIGPRQYLVIAIDENSARPQATISEPDRPGATISEVEEKIT